MRQRDGATRQFIEDWSRPTLFSFTPRRKELVINPSDEAKPPAFLSVEAGYWWLPDQLSRLHSRLMKIGRGVRFSLKEEREIPGMNKMFWGSLRMTGASLELTVMRKRMSCHFLMDISPLIKACEALAILKIVSSETGDGPFKKGWSRSVQVPPMGFIVVASCLALAAVVSNALIENFWSLGGWPFDVCVCLGIRQVYEGSNDHDGEPGGTQRGSSNVASGPDEKGWIDRNLPF